MEPIAWRFLKLHRLIRKQIQISLSDPVTEQHLRPAIRDNMMDLNQHSPGILPGPKQHEPVQRAILQRNHLSGHRMLPALHPLRAGMRKIQNRKNLLRIRRMILHRPSPASENTGTQRTIRSQHQIHALLQSIKIDPSLDSNGRTDIVNGCPGISLLQIPNILLAQRQGKSFRFQSSTIRNHTRPPFL